MAPRSKKSIVSDVVISIISDSRLRGKWVSLSTLEEALKQRYDFGDHLELTSTLLSKVMAGLVPDIDSLKHSRNGMYRIQHHYAVPDGKTKKIHFFYFQDKQKPPPKHPSINDSWDKILFCQRSILQSFKQQGTRHQNKKPRVRENVDDELLEMRSTFTAEAIKHKVPAFDYWKSANAIKLFNPLPGEPVQETLHRRNKNLLDFVNHPEQHVAEMFEGYAELPPLTVRQMDQFLKQSLYLAKAYENASIYMGTAHQAWTWHQCCDAAIDELATLGITKITSARTLGRWNIAFRRDEIFFHPVYRCKPLEPKLLFACFPEVKNKIHSFCQKKENLASLSVESLRNEIVDTIIPEIYETLLQEQQEHEDFEEEEFWTKEEMLAYLGLKSISPSTVWRWMQRLGYKYSETKKCYYVDGHEKPETKAYRKKFVKRYFESEKLMHRWIQITLTAKVTLEEEEGIEIAHGYHYTDQTTNLQMVEFHVDDHHTFQDDMNQNTQFGGNLSVRKPLDKKPVICFGQDECIMKQYCFTTKSWTAPSGQKAIIPKDDGQGVMLSAFVSRKFGFGFTLTQEQLQTVNQARRGQKYSDEAAANEKRGSADKKDLTDSPFVVEFEYGANAQGY